MACRAAIVAKFVKQCSQHESLEVGDYLRAIAHLCSMELGFEDVQQFLFTTNQNVLLNLIGLHYSLLFLGIPVIYLFFICIIVNFVCCYVVEIYDDFFLKIFMG